MNVSDFASATGLSPHTIRYYEKIGLLGKIARNQSGHRMFTARDLDWIAFVQRLKDTGMSLEHILHYAELRAAGSVTVAERQQLLQDHAIQLADTIASYQQHLQKLNDKITRYKNGQVS